MYLIMNSVAKKVRVQFTFDFLLQVISYRCRFIKVLLVCVSHHCFFFLSNVLYKKNVWFILDTKNFMLHFFSFWNVYSVVTDLCLASTYSERLILFVTNYCIEMFVFIMLMNGSHDFVRDSYRNYLSVNVLRQVKETVERVSHGLPYWETNSLFRLCLRYRFGFLMSFLLDFLIIVVSAYGDGLFSLRSIVYILDCESVILDFLKWLLEGNIAILRG